MWHQETVTGTRIRQAPTSHNLFARDLSLRALRPKAASDPQFKHPGDDRLDAETGGVDDTGIVRRTQRGNLTGLISQVPLGYLARKGGKVNSGPLVFQLLIAPQGPLFGGCGQEYLEGGTGKHHRAHIAPV